MNPQPPVSVAIVLVPRFPLHAFAFCVDTLRVANREALGTVFDWHVVSENGEPVVSSTDVPVPADLGIDQVDFVPMAIVLAGYEPDHGHSDRLRRWLRRLDRRGASLGCVDTGAAVLAAAGLLANTTVSVHREALSGMREDYRVGEFTDSAFVFDRRRSSSAGGIATVDMMLELVARIEGPALADRVAEMLNYSRTRTNAHVPLAAAARAHPVLARSVDRMLANIEDTLSLTDLAAAVGSTSWTLRRLFRRHLGTTPMRHYRALRLERARQLLAYSHLTVSEIATACGFSEVASFSRAFTQHFGEAPSRSRHDEAGLPMRDRPPG